MSRLTLLAGALLLALSPALAAQELLIRNATVHTATARGTLSNADVLVSGGKIAAIGANLAAPAGVPSVDAGGRPLTPTLFGGITRIGLEEVSGESKTVDGTLTLGRATREMTVRPEFDVTLAFNPESALLAVNRVEGLGWTLLGPGTGEGGSIIAGQGAIVQLDGSPDPAGPKVLFVELGNDVSSLTGQSRAAQWMLLEQFFDEARGRIPATSPMAMLTPAARAVLAKFFQGQGRVMFKVDRAADIRQLLRFADRHDLRIAISGGA